MIQNNEKIIEKLQKIKALSERGECGEAMNAKRMLEKWLLKYNITLDDLSSDEKKRQCFNVNHSNGSLGVFLMCALKLFGMSRSKDIFYYKGQKSKIYIELTNLEYSEMMQFYDFHKKNFEKERKKMLIEFEQAYQYKHDLYATDNEDGKKSERKQSEEEIMRIIRLVQSLEDVTYHKQLTQ
ncbi:hypothetical protein SAMD00024442_6_11 [Candidatus Symbiothrix dinenymphae]|nr:hypothetical protein SAMD00024442_6_11 [Candidatus Symbiothrix dinenymphae]